MTPGLTSAHLLSCTLYTRSHRWGGPVFQVVVFGCFSCSSTCVIAGIFLFTAMGLLLYHANDTMRKIVTLKEERRGVRQQLAIFAISTIGHCQLWVMWTHKYQLWRNLLPVPVGQRVTSVRALAFSVYMDCRASCVWVVL